MRLLDAICNRPWLMTADALRVMVEVVTGVQRDVQLAEALRTAREERPATLALRGGQPLDGTRLITVRDGVAHLPIVGPIVRYADIFSRVSGLSSIETIAADLHTAIESPAVKAILLEMDTPGGEVTGVAALGSAIYAARARKPIWAYVDGMAASAGYWLASATDQIITDPAGMLGSIGAVLAVRDPSKQISTSITFVSSQSPRKRPDPLTEDGRGEYQQIVDATAEAFIEAVAQHRNVSTETVISQFGHGGVLVGKYALAAGLADGIGTFETTLAELANPKQKETFIMPQWKDMWAGFFGAAREAGALDETATVQNLPSPPPPPAPLVSAGPADEPNRAELEALQQQLAEVQTERRTQAARMFASSHVQAGRLAPAEIDQLIALHTEAAALSPTLATKIEAFVAARPAVLADMTKEAVPANLTALNLDGSPAAAKVDEEEARIRKAARRYHRANAKGEAV